MSEPKETTKIFCSGCLETVEIAYDEIIEGQFDCDVCESTYERDFCSDECLENYTVNF